MKFQIPSMHHSEVNRRTDRQTDRQAESNMPFQLFQSWRHKNSIKIFTTSEKSVYHMGVVFIMMTSIILMLI